MGATEATLAHFQATAYDVPEQYIEVSGLATASALVIPTAALVALVTFVTHWTNASKRRRVIYRNVLLALTLACTVAALIFQDAGGRWLIVIVAAMILALWAGLRAWSGHQKPPVPATGPPSLWQYFLALLSIPILAGGMWLYAAIVGAIMYATSITGPVRVLESSTKAGSPVLVFIEGDRAVLRPLGKTADGSLTPCGAFELKGSDGLKLATYTVKVESAQEGTTCSSGAAVRPK
ncbi:hypothetical protein AB4Z14_04430 [Terrabacter sp. 2TAF16]|uniref:hypothetical protein n=1 Tax=Terrabacter sp. 2TAF16 TaxID=3233008 RepID=UPI003F9D8E61